MRKTVSSLTSLGLLLAQAVGAAASDVDICVRLKQEKGAGLFLYYPSAPLEEQLQRAGSGVPLTYDAGARFFYVSKNQKPTDREVVWNVKMRTTTDSDVRANDVYVYRGATSTGCANSMPVFSFIGDRFLSLKKYIDYHADTGRSDQGLQNYFHFGYNRSAEKTADCVRTDDSKIVGNLKAQYGFPDLSETDGDEFRAVSRKRRLPTDERVGGYSSELTYVPKNQFGCFGFDIPYPTQSSALGRALGFYRFIELQKQVPTWQPAISYVSINRLAGGKKKEITIQWQSK
jgi:hypothetical protein